LTIIDNDVKVINNDSIKHQLDNGYRNRDLQSVLPRSPCSAYEWFRSFYLWIFMYR